MLVPESSADNEVPYMNVNYEEQHVVKPISKQIPKTLTLPANSHRSKDDICESSPTIKRTVYDDIDDGDGQDQPFGKKAATLGSTASAADIIKDKKPIPKPKPIKVDNLADYIAKFKANNSEGFKAEFRVRKKIVSLDVRNNVFSKPCFPNAYTSICYSLHRLTPFLYKYPQKAWIGSTNPVNTNYVKRIKKPKHTCFAHKHACTYYFDT